MEERLILGLDLSLNSTGYVIVKFTESKDNTIIEVIEKGLIKAKSNETHSKKLKRQYRRLNQIKEQYSGKNLIVVKENLHYGRPKTAAILGKAHGVADLIFPHIHAYGPSTIKKEVAGNGRVSKEEVEQAVKNMVKLGHEMRFKSDDESDAVAVAITHYLKIKED